MKRGLEDLEKLKIDFKRFIFGILFGIVIILAIFLLNRLEFFFICIILIALSVYELFSIFDLNKYRYFILPEILSILVAFTFIFLTPSIFIFVVFLSIFLIIFKNILFFKNDAGKSLFIDIFSVFYAGFFISYLLKILDLDSGRLLLMLLFILVWASDIFAYYGGRHFGRRRLFFSLSPKKTVEGALTGFLFAILTALVFRIFIANYRGFTLFSFTAISVLTVISGMIGDLAESLVKRIGGKKDSGFLIPGHGGILDRIDSLILAAPSFYYVTLFFLNHKN
ncbi:MAG: phosphatidate cytidylyltransferase [Deltaproteobacteria bacterium]|nr:phosphatidate cytidylyltransferase [Deltaproteobacteria bacterium]